MNRCGLIRAVKLTECRDFCVSELAQEVFDFEGNFDFLCHLWSGFVCFRTPVSLSSSSKYSSRMVAEFVHNKYKKESQVSAFGKSFVSFKVEVLSSTEEPYLYGESLLWTSIPVFDIFTRLMIGKKQML